MGRDGTAAEAGQRLGKGTAAYYIEPYKRFFAVRDRGGALVVVAVYRKGADEVVRRLTRAGGKNKVAER